MVLVVSDDVANCPAVFLSYFSLSFVMKDGLSDWQRAQLVFTLQTVANSVHERSICYSRKSGGVSYFYHYMGSKYGENGSIPFDMDLTLDCYRGMKNAKKDTDTTVGQGVENLAEAKKNVLGGEVALWTEQADGFSVMSR